MTPRPGRLLDAIPGARLRTVTLLAGGAFVALSVPIQMWERRMRATGGPGITGLQLAMSAPAAQVVLDTWGPAGRRAARQQTWADFTYLKTYAYAGVCGSELLRRRTAPASRWDRWGRTVRWLPLFAATCDAVENFALLRTLARADHAEVADRAARPDRDDRAEDGEHVGHVAHAQHGADVQSVDGSDGAQGVDGVQGVYGADGVQGREQVDGATVGVTLAAASTKFALLLVSIGWAAGAATIGARSARGG